MCYAVCIEIIWTSMKKMICFEDQNCQFIMILWYMYEYCNIIHSYYIFHLWWYFYYFEQKNVLGLNVFHLLDLFKFIGLYYLF